MTQKLSRLFLLVAIALTAITSLQARDNDPRWEKKTILIPMNHQSGWDLRSNSQSAPQAKAPVAKPAPVAQTPPPTTPPEKPAQAAAIPLDKWVLNGVQFEIASDVIKAGSTSTLDSAAETLKSHPTVTVEIQGHTDNTGSPAFNQILSDKRATSVKNYLVKKGVVSGRISSRGYGDTQPIASNDTKDGRTANRRIEFKVLTR